VLVLFLVFWWCVKWATGLDPGKTLFLKGLGGSTQLRHASGPRTVAWGGVLRPEGAFFACLKNFTFEKKVFRFVVLRIVINKKKKK
jgi:hypothetical protein